MATFFCKHIDNRTVSFQASVEAETADLAAEAFADFLSAQPGPASVISVAALRGRTLDPDILYNVTWSREVVRK